MKRFRGHTLLEVFIAAVLVSITIFAAFSLYPACTASLRKSHALSNAVGLAQQQMELVASTPFEQVPNLTATPLSATIDGIVYTVSLTHDPNGPPASDATNAAIVHQVDVEVDWSSGSMTGPSSVTYSLCVYDFTNTP